MDGKVMFTQTIALTVLSLVFHLNVVGQNAPISKCGADDHECLVFELTKKINLNPQNYEYYYVRAGSYSALKKYDLAFQDYDKAIELNPKSDLAYAGRGYAHYSQDQYVEAVAEFKKAIKLNPTNDYALESLKSCLSLIERSSSAIDFYDKLIQMEPNNAEYYYGRSKKQFVLKNFDKAIADSSKAIELNPAYTDVYMSRAISYCKIGKRKGSAADIAKYDQLKGIKTKGICQIDIETCRKDDDDCRMSVFTEGINKPHEMAWAYPNRLENYHAGRGTIYYKRGDLERALNDFNAAFVKSGFDQEHLYRGNIYLRKYKYDEALTDFQTALRSVKNSAELYLGIGEIYVFKREYEKAFENFEQAIFLNPRLSNAYIGRGITYLELGENYLRDENNQAKSIEAYKNAVKDFDSAAEIDLKKTPPEVYIKRAKAHEKLGETDKAAADRAKYKELSEKP